MCFDLQINVVKSANPTAPRRPRALARRRQRELAHARRGGVQVLLGYNLHLPKRSGQFSLNLKSKIWNQEITL